MKLDKSKPDFDNLADPIEVPDNFIELKTEEYSKGGKPPYEVRKALGRTATRAPMGWWPDDKKVEVAALYASGMTDVEEMSRITMVPIATLRTWKQSEWWPELMDRIHTTRDEEMDSKFTRIVDDALNVVHDRVVNGDIGIDKDTGEQYRKPMNGKDAAIVSAIIVDKRQLLRGKPTNRVERIGLDDRLSKIAEQFRNFIESKEVKNEETPDSNIIDITPESSLVTN